ncbi:MAG TPA: hypothetical protein DCE71_08710 [Parachlamydiales bacterium]|nr:hypothetical protein [Parachlamydiales bacterium]
MGSSLLLACSCSGQKEQPEKQKGPQQDPFEHPAGMDSEGEEGAASDVLQTIIDTPSVAEVEKKVEEKSQDSTVFVTPVVVEAVKMQAQPPAVLVQESSAAKESSSLIETVSVSSTETPASVQ